MTARRLGALIAVMMLAALASAIAFAPASFVDLALDRATLGRVRLADASGTVWSGSGRLVLSQPGPSDASMPQARMLGGFAIPSRIGWQLRVLPLAVGIVDASVTLAEGRPAVRLSGNPAELRVGAGSLDLPSAQLAGLGSPWNTIRPSAAVSMRWEALTVRQGVLDGRASIELKDTASAMTPVRPLGSYRIEVTGTGREVRLALSTLSGPLILQGRGNWDRRAGVRFNAEARAEGPQQATLQSLLSLIGRRVGDKTLIRIGG